MSQSKQKKQKQYIGKEDHDRWVCTHCGLVCKGKSGLGRHLASAGGRNHVDAPEIPDYDEHLQFDERNGIIWVPDESWKPAVRNSLRDRESHFMVLVPENWYDHAP